MKKLIATLFFLTAIGTAQNTSFFAAEVEAITKKYDTLWNANKETIVFTGSSSIRMWHSLNDQFPSHQIVNSGFGGSQASDLLEHCNPLILHFKPKKVFIYEGDNDISTEKKTKEILKDITAIITKIKAQNTNTEIILIAAKPSIARWNLKRRYKKLNRKLKKLCDTDVNLYFADVWNPMLNGKKLKRDIFLQDGLHMTADGYDIWFKAIKPFVEK